MKRACVRSGRLAAAAIVFGCVCASAHNIRVSNVLLTDWDDQRQTVHVKCDLAWDNSWRDAGNWDAAWIFVKVRPQGSNDWQHAALSNVDGDHTPPAGSVVESVPDGIGVFVYRSGAGVGHVSYTGLKLCWTYATNGYAFDSGTPVEVSVHAIEMVYVPQGAFMLGSTGGESGHFYRPDGTEQTTNAYPVTSEDAIEIGPGADKLWGTSTSGNNTIGPEGTLPKAFPKGYQAFYCMKYEGTQGQYAEFLNKLTVTQSASRYNPTNTERYTISGTYPAFAAAAPDRACNWLSWRDGCAYLAWAGLRPMTEFEYEKACRGPALPVAGEYAWGGTAIKQQTGHAGVDGSGTSTATTASGIANCNYGNAVLIGGPVRAGIYATAASTREQAGASYWGIMELSGNVHERCVTVGKTEGRAFTGDLGTGSLTPEGDAPCTAWTVVTGACCGRRGGSWMHASGIQRVSDRTYVALQEATRYSIHGFRGVRSAP